MSRREQAEGERNPSPPGEQAEAALRVAEEARQALAASEAQYRSLAEAMGGELTAESEPGKGSIFRLTLELPRRTGAVEMWGEHEAAADDDARVAALPLAAVEPRGEPAGIFAVMLTGDGGWAPFDRSIAAVLSQHGVGVVGWDALRYLWTAKTPAENRSNNHARLIQGVWAAECENTSVLGGKTPWLARYSPVLTWTRVWVSPI